MCLLTFFCSGTWTLLRVYTNCSLLYQERSLIREGCVLYQIARRTPKPEHSLVLLPDQVGGTSRRPSMHLFREIHGNRRDPSQFLQPQLRNLLTWKYLWCLMIVTRQLLHASFLLSVQIGMSCNYASWLAFPHASTLWTKSTLGWELGRQSKQEQSPRTSFHAIIPSLCIKDSLKTCIEQTFVQCM